MQNAKLTIIIVTWNSKNYIYNALESIINQDFKDYIILVIDNNSMDGTVNTIRDIFPATYIIQNSKNAGFCKANNQGIKLSKSDYVLTMNPDVVLKKDFLSAIIAFADSHADGGSFCGKIYKLARKKNDTGEKSDDWQYNEHTNIIDAEGIIMKKNRVAINRGEGRNDSAAYSMHEKIFGAPGCLALYRRAALEDIKMENEYFDERFFAYKEDVDLAWRLNLRGWNSWYVPQSIAWHKRNFCATQEKKIITQITARKKMPKKLRFLSFRNQYLMMIKNDSLVNIIAHFPHIIIKIANDFLLMLLLEPFQWKNAVELPRLFFKYAKKRRSNLTHAKVSSREIRKLFS